MYVRLSVEIPLNVIVDILMAFFFVFLLLNILGTRFGNNGAGQLALFLK